MLFLAQGVIAQAVFTPAQPNAQNVIQAQSIIPSTCGLLGVETLVAGSTIRTTVSFGGCILGPPAPPLTVDAFFGPVPAGTYTYEVYVVWPEPGSDPPLLFSTQPLVIAAAPAAIPTTSEWGRIALGLALAIFGVMLIRHLPSSG